MKKAYLGAAIFCALGCIGFITQADILWAVITAALAALFAYLFLRARGQQPASPAPLVYITPGGSHYHSTPACPHIGAKAQAVTLKKAQRQGLKPCGHCAGR